MDVPVENYNINTLTAVIWLGGVIVMGVTSALVVVWKKWGNEREERKEEVKMMAEIFEKITSNQELTSRDIEHMKKYAEDTKPTIERIDRNVDRLIN